MLLHFTRNAVESVRNENVQIYTTKTPNTVNPNTLKPESSGPDALNSKTKTRKPAFQPQSHGFLVPVVDAGAPGGGAAPHRGAGSRLKGFELQELGF